MPNETRPPQGRIHWQNLVTVISMMILIGTEVFGAAMASAWAIAGLFELGHIVQVVLMVLFGLLGLYAMVMLWRRAVALDPISGRP